MTLPNGVDPAKVPTRERLGALTDDELFAIIHYLPGGFPRDHQRRTAALPTGPAG